VARTVADEDAEDSSSPEVPLVKRKIANSDDQKVTSVFLLHFCSAQLHMI
jgi:hypothetical protein